MDRRRVRRRRPQHVRTDPHDLPRVGDPAFQLFLGHPPTLSDEPLDLRLRSKPYRSTMPDKDRFSPLGVAAAACIACCAPLLLSFLAGLGLASTVCFRTVGIALVGLAAIVAIVRHRRRPAACAADASCRCD